MNSLSGIIVLWLEILMVDSSCPIRSGHYYGCQDYSTSSHSSPLTILSLPSPMHFGNSQYSTAHIRDNGMISFVGDNNLSVPTSFPVHSPVIAPYWWTTSNRNRSTSIHLDRYEYNIAIRSQVYSDFKFLDAFLTDSTGSSFKADWILWIDWYYLLGECTYLSCPGFRSKSIVAVQNDVTYALFSYDCPQSLDKYIDRAVIGFSADNSMYCNYPLSNMKPANCSECIVYRISSTGPLPRSLNSSMLKCNFGRVKVEIFPEIRELQYTTMGQQTMTFHQNISIPLYSDLTISCDAVGNPLPSITWYKDGHAITSQSSMLTISKVNLTDRGFYKCSATNYVGVASSKEFVLNITGILQYRIDVDAVNETSTERFINHINGSLVKYFQNNSSRYKFLSVKEYQRVGNLILTLFGSDYDEVRNEETGELVTEAVKFVIDKEFPYYNVNRTALRFDGCPPESIPIPHTTRDPFPELQINWPETNIGDTAVVTCPCGNNVELSSSNLQATRRCGGNFNKGAVWQSAHDAPCNFSDVARKMCYLSQRSTIEIFQALEDITNDTVMFQSADIIVAISVLATAREDSLGNTSLSESFFSIIDNLAGANKRELQISQEQANTSARMLHDLILVTKSLNVSSLLESDVNVTNDNDNFLSLQRSFVIVKQELTDLQLTQTGQTLAVYLGDSFTISGNPIDANNLELSTKELNNSAAATASIRVPGEAFKKFSNASELVHFVFLTDSLFLRRNNNNKEVGSIIVSASVTGTSISGLNDPVIINFLRNPNITNDTSQACVFWDPMLDGGYGDWSSEGCTVKTSTDINIVCHCTHLTSFSILMDVSPTLQNKPRSMNKIISAISYIGIIVSICCLLLTIISYLCIRKLRLSDHGQLLISLCLSLLGLYVMFIFAIHSPKVTSLCGVISFLLHYFFLVTFLNMAAESINLYRKLVIVLGSNISHYVIKTVIISWLLPVLIVLFCFVTNYRNYISDHFCRAYNIPYYIGMLGPFIAIYIFNWIIFVIIFVSLLKKFLSKDIQKAKQDATKKKLYQQFQIMVSLSVLFGLGWGIGLAATQQSFTNQIVPDILSGLFVCLTGFHGLFIFVLYCIRNENVRNAWRECFYKAIRKKERPSPHDKSTIKRSNQGPSFHVGQMTESQEHKVSGETSLSDKTLNSPPNDETVLSNPIILELEKTECVETGVMPDNEIESTELHFVNPAFFEQ